MQLKLLFIKYLSLQLIEIQFQEESVHRVKNFNGFLDSQGHCRIESLTLLNFLLFYSVLAVQSMVGECIGWNGQCLELILI